MNPAWTALVGRWDAAREAILARFDGVLSESTMVSEPIAATITTDASALERMWQPVEAKMHAMTDEVSDAWDTISDEMADLDGAPENGVFIEGIKRDATTTEIEIRHGRARAAVFAKVAIAMHQHARTSGDATAVQMFAHGGAVYLAEQAAVEHWAGMKTAETKIQAYRNEKAVPMQLLTYYAQVSAGYWRVRHTTEAKYNQAQRASLETKIANFTKESHKLLHGFPQWRAAAQ
ncbi:MAG: hypothetical protein KUG77_20775 [Nannocystaceae bacterium]|nr:hypothetical protein [Nannocystaceae bacterium]